VAPLNIGVQCALMDTGKIGLLVTGIAVILAIPLSVVANLLTPRLQSWYSTTSQKRAKKRLGHSEHSSRIVSCIVRKDVSGCGKRSGGSCPLGNLIRVRWTI